MAADTAGAGRYRGGVSAEVGLTLAVDQAIALVMTHGQQSPNAMGLSGGYPGATIRHAMVHDAVDDLRFKDGEWEHFGPKPGTMPMTKSDLFVSSWQGGGGWGDPLDREQEAVARDVRTGRVSQAAARTIYGVVVDGDGGLDEAETTRVRREIRLARVGGSFVEDPARTFTGERVLRLGASLHLGRQDGEWVVVSEADYILVRGSTQWRQGAVTRRMEQPEPEANVLLHEDLVMTACYCPASGTLLSLDTHRHDEPLSDDVLLDLDRFPTSTSERSLSRAA
jgi:N-methylhydantoinase B